MVDEEKLLESLAVVQYEKCDLCRRNHRKGKGHVYTKAHRTVLQNIITKFSQKVSLAKKSVKVPGVHSAAWEVGARRWCYFCKNEVQRHHRDAITAIQDASFLRHLASEEHKANTLKFWREQRLEKDKHIFFLVEKNKLEKYEAAWKLAVESFLAEQEGKRKTEAARIARQEMMRGRLVRYQQHHIMSQIVQSESEAQHHTAPSTATDTVTFVRTVAAKATGLTIVAPRAYDKNVGNIYSGAPPPWMQTNSSDSDRVAVTIGPTQDDLTRHLENERKGKLPATRVGAKFDHQGATGAEWLPSFGRVWSSQRRMHGQKHFMQALKKPTSSNFHNRQRPSSAAGRADMCTDHTDTYLPASKTANTTTSYQRMPLDVGSGGTTTQGDSNTHYTGSTSSNPTVQGDSVPGYRPTHRGNPYHNGRGQYDQSWPQTPGVSAGYNGGGEYHHDSTSGDIHAAQHYKYSTGPSHVHEQTNIFNKYAYNGASHGSSAHHTVGIGSSSSQLNNIQQQPPKKISRIKIATSLIK